MDFSRVGSLKFDRYFESLDRLFLAISHQTQPIPQPRIAPVSELATTPHMPTVIISHSVPGKSKAKYTFTVIPPIKDISPQRTPQGTFPLVAPVW